MSQDEPQTAAQQAEETRADARGTELRAELAETDARRTEEQVTEAHEKVEAAQKEEAELSRRAHLQREQAERAAADAQRDREQAAHAAEIRDDAARATPAQSATMRPPGAPQPVTERPEVLLGAAFAGTFIVARILKRIFD